MRLRRMAVAGFAAALLCAGSACGDTADAPQVLSVSFSQLDGTCPPDGVARLRLGLTAWLEIEAEGDSGLARQCAFDFASTDPADLTVEGECRLPRLRDARLTLGYAYLLETGEEFVLATLTLTDLDLRNGRNIIDFAQAEVDTSFDADMDGAINLVEVCAGTDIQDSESVPAEPGGEESGD